MINITSEKLPIKMWLDDIEEGALQQAKNLANLPFAFRNIAIMPDSHQGFGMPIGGVLATDGVIIPNAVGVDIGCGMCAVQTTMREIDRETLKKILEKIRNAIPLGFNHHKKNQDPELMPNSTDMEYVVNAEYDSALKQIGTLGGGNHFIEFQNDSDGHIWIMIHSGSRNIGKQVADYYNKLADKLNGKWDYDIPKSWQLSYLPIDSNEGKAYIKEMNYCVEFALANRKLMMDRICDILMDTAYTTVNGLDFAPMINIAHNYANLENHFGMDVMVHRKGATLATEDTIGIIPGSQGTKSYIVRGKGNPDSFNSCSHGAGRKMSRTKAEKDLNLDEEIRKLDKQGILHAIRGKKDLDEASGAYKDISIVMGNQKDLVEVLVELSPLAVIKG
jgi:tRNA-splicing ligase RtcB